MNVFDALIEKLEKAKEAAMMTKAGFGFPNDRLEIKSVHFGDDRIGRIGDVLHPTEYILRITDLYRKTWIIHPIDEALSLLEKTCKWKRQDFDSDCYETSCDQAFCLTDGTPKANDFKFCAYCGRKIESD